MSPPSSSIYTHAMKKEKRRKFWGESWRKSSGSLEPRRQPLNNITVTSFGRARRRRRSSKRPLLPRPKNRPTHELSSNAKVITKTQYHCHILSLVTPSPSWLRRWRATAAGKRKRKYHIKLHPRISLDSHVEIRFRHDHHVQNVE